jgi:hypothetical protein
LVAPLKAALDATITIILTHSDGKPWTSDGFRASRCAVRR